MVYTRQMTQEAWLIRVQRMTMRMPAGQYPRTVKWPPLVTGCLLRSILRKRRVRAGSAGEGRSVVSTRSCLKIVKCAFGVALVARIIQQ
jgi:hypothetical protein